MKRKKILFIILSIVVIVIITFIINGITIQTTNFIFTTKYYNDPQLAFEKQYSPSAVEEPIEITTDIYLYDIDDYNTLYFGLKKNNELIICQMYKKNDKYFYIGDYELYYLDILVRNVSSRSDSHNLYGENGKLESSCEWFLSIDENKYEDMICTKVYDCKIENADYSIFLIFNK